MNTKVRCNKCNKEIECEVTNPVYQDATVKVYDNNPCCPGYKMFEKIGEITISDVIPKEKNITFKCHECNKEGKFYSRSDVIYKNGASKCCQSINYTVEGIDKNIPRWTHIEEDYKYQKDLYGTGDKFY